MPLYHAHLYFKPDQLPLAQSLFGRIQNEEFPPLYAHRLFMTCVGPHALPMVELHFRDADKARCIQWLQDHRSELSVLIHEDSGDDHKDHSQNVVWLGNPLPIDFEFFRLIEKRPELMVHPAR